MERSYSKAIADSIISHFKNEDYDGYQFDEKKGTIYFNASIDCPIDTLMYTINIYREGYVVHALLPLKIPMKVMDQMISFVCYANRGLPPGNFELDPDEGDITFKFSVTCTGGVVPSEEMVEESLFMPFIMMKKYIPGIIDVFFGKKNGKAACYMCDEIDNDLIIPEEESDSDADIARLLDLINSSDDEKGSDADNDHE